MRFEDCWSHGPGRAGGALGVLAASEQWQVQGSHAGLRRHDGPLSRSAHRPKAGDEGDFRMDSRRAAAAAGLQGPGHAVEEPRGCGPREQMLPTALRAGRAGGSERANLLPG